MKHGILAAAFLCMVFSVPAHASGDDSSKLLLLPGAVSQAGMYAVAGSRPWWGEEYDDTFLMESLLYASSAASPFGLYRSSPAAAGTLHLVQGAAAAGGWLNHQYGETGYLGNSLVNLAVKSGMYSGYLTYADLRQEESTSLAVLAAAPLTNLSSPFVWGSIAVCSFLGAAEGLSGEGVPVWDSREVQFPGHGRTYPRSVGIPLYAAAESLNMLITGIGEETYYRGVVYRELKEQLGSGWAKALNAVLFPLFHLPQELWEIQQGEMSVGGAAAGFAVRSGITVLLDTAYDAGGLELSTAVHTWINLALHLARFITGGGVP